MAIFKALRSPKQMTAYNGGMIQASNYVYETEDKELIKYLGQNPNWEEMEGSSTPKKPAPAKSEEKPKLFKKKKSED